MSLGRLAYDNRWASVTLDEFAAVDEPGADAILGDADSALIPEGGDAMVYGDGGVGKTTLIDRPRLPPGRRRRLARDPRRRGRCAS